jgi:hypothetical protein
MMKSHETMKEMEEKAARALNALIGQVPAIQIEKVEVEAMADNRHVDILARITVSDQPHMLVCEVKADGQPRHVRAALLQLRNYAAHFGKDATPIFIAPYLSPEAQALCKENNVGFLDLEGNARITFRNVFIERLVSSKPTAARRALKSIFKPKSAQVLRLMLRDPRHVWRVAELAESAGVSLGHASNVRTGLMDREWGQLSQKGLHISRPDALLDVWRDVYDPPSGKRLGFYTTLHGSAFEEAARQVLGVQSEKACFASFSAAHWLAPYGRTGTQYFYADNFGLERLKERLKLAPSHKGENVVVTVLKDDGPFFDTVEPAPGAVCTSAVQTYLDLWAAGERGKEAADHLRKSRLSWQA